MLRIYQSEPGQTSTNELSLFSAERFGSADETHFVPNDCFAVAYPVESREERESCVDTQPNDIIVLAAEVNLQGTLKIQQVIVKLEKSVSCSRKLGCGIGVATHNASKARPLLSATSTASARRRSSSKDVFWNKL